MTLPASSPTPSSLPCSSSLAVLQEHHTEGGRGGEELAPAPQGPGFGSGHGSGGAMAAGWNVVWAVQALRSQG